VYNYDENYRSNLWWRKNYSNKWKYRKKAKVLIIFLDEDYSNFNDVKGISAQELLKYSGSMKSFKEDPVEYQRKLRN